MAFHEYRSSGASSAAASCCAIGDETRGFEQAASMHGRGGLPERASAVLVGGALAVKPGFKGGVEVRLEVPVGAV
jgi:hypothetical protein